MPTDLFDDTHMAAQVQRGLTFQAFTKLQSTLRITREQLARAIQVPPRTLLRRSRLKLAESERLLRYLRLAARARMVFGRDQRVREWMFSENVALGGRTPFDLAHTEPGARLVEKILGRLEHGVFS